MYTVKVVCDGNFTEATEIDKSVDKLMKMFKKHAACKSKPLASDSNMECIYEYRGLSHDELRIMKRLLSTRGGSISLKAIESCVENDNSHHKKRKKSRKDKKAKRSTSSTSSVASSTNGSSVDEELGSESAQSEVVPTEDTASALICEARELCTSMRSLIDRLECVVSPDLCSVGGSEDDG